VGVLLLVRHGQASFGSADYDRLSLLGEAQAELVARRLAGLPSTIRDLVSGSLVRQRATAQAIAQAGRLDARSDDRWDEYDHVGIAGEHSSELVFDPKDTAGARDRAETALDRAVRRWVAGNADAVESHPDFVTRCSAALQSVTGAPGTTVIATSGGVIAVIGTMLLGLPVDAWPSLARVSINTGITKIVTGRQGTTLVAFNDHAHLEHDPALITYR
jgi:broad specificity phosphatase PhoE